MPISQTAELFIDGVWTDITTFIHADESIIITRGRGDWFSHTEHGTMEFTVKNADGRFNPKNPLGAWYGKIGHNTPFRYSVDGGYRFYGEMTTWALGTNTTDTNPFTRLEASGVLRRLSRGAALRSVYYRYMTRTTDNPPAFYWPLELNHVGEVVGAGDRFRTLGDVARGNFDGFPGSNPVFTIGNNGRIYLNSTLPNYKTGPNGQKTIQFRFMLHVPEDGVDSDSLLLRLITGGSAREWRIRLSTSGNSHTLEAYDANGNQILTAGPNAYTLAGVPTLVELDLQEVGSDTDYDLRFMGLLSGASNPTGGTLAGRTCRRAKHIIFGGGARDLKGTAIGHVSIQGYPSFFGQSSPPQPENSPQRWFNGQFGEPAGERFERLCVEQGVESIVLGTVPSSDTQVMGVQKVAAFLGLIRECEKADQGFLHEYRDDLALVFRPRKSFYNDAPGATLNYSQRMLSEALMPVPDDQLIKNNVEITVEGGDSSRYTVQRSTVNSPRALRATLENFTDPPPAGVGLYPHEETINLDYDEIAYHHAGWIAHRGTVDEARFPQVVINFANAAISSNATLNAALNAIEVGDMLRITNPPSYLAPDDIDLLVVGYTEELGEFERTVQFNCIPQSPYKIAEFGGSETTESMDDVFPDLDAQSIATPTNASTTHSVSIPSTTAGAMVVVVVAFGLNQGTISLGDLRGQPWTEVHRRVMNLGDDPMQLITFAVQDDVGGSATSVTATNDDGVGASWQSVAYRFSAGTHDGPGNIFARSTNSYQEGTGFGSLTPDPPSLGLSDSAKYTWIAAASWQHYHTSPATLDTSAGNGGYPVNYTIQKASSNPTGTDRPGLAVVGRQIETGSQNPNVFDLAHTTNHHTGWIVMTLAVQPHITTDTAAAGIHRFESSDSRVASSFDAGTDTSLSVEVAEGPLWRTFSSDPGSEYDIRVAGVVLHVTAVSGVASPQTFTVTQAAVNGVTKTIPVGETIRLADKPVLAL